MGDRRMHDPLPERTLGTIFNKFKAYGLTDRDAYKLLYELVFCSPFTGKICVDMVKSIVKFRYHVVLEDPDAIKNQRSD